MIDNEYSKAEDKKPTITVIVPMYNAEAYISECIDSILHQTIRDFEILVIDDGSTDSSGHIVEKYASDNTQVRVIHQKNQGLVRSRKVGVENAQGKYIGFVDADDVIEPLMYETMLTFVQDNDLDFVSVGIIDNGVERMDLLDEGVYPKDEKANWISRIIPCTTHHMQGVQGIIPNTYTKLYKREIFLEKCMDVPDEIRFREDNCFVYTYLLSAERIGVLHRAFYHYRYNANSHSQIQDELFFSRINRCYLYLKKQFEQSIYSNVLLPQLQFFIIYTMAEGLNRMNYDANAVVSVSYPLEGVRRVVVYGAGAHGDRIARRIIDSGKHELLGVIDKNYKNMSERPYKVFPLEKLKSMDYEKILIAVLSRDIASSIEQDLIATGINKEDICIV